MTVFHVAKNTNYTVMSNHHLRNRELSLKAKGLLSQMLSLPEKWDYTLQGLVYINREQTDAIRQAVHELERAGYISCGQGNGITEDGCGDRSTPSTNSRESRQFYRRWNNLRRENRCWKILCR